MVVLDKLQLASNSTTIKETKKALGYHKWIDINLCVYIEDNVTFNFTFLLEN